MSMILQQNWEFLSREHEYFIRDPAYLKWVYDIKNQQPLTPEEEKQWQNIVQTQQKLH